MILPMAIVNTGCRICRSCIIDCAAVVRAENRVPRLTLLEANRVIFPVLSEAKKNQKAMAL